jgi:type IV pilus assembly protein PilO
LLIAVIFVASWFLLISPKRGEAASLRQETLSQEEANSRLAQQLDVLKAQQADLPKQRAKLAAIRGQIPDNPALPTLIRDLTTAGRKVGVSIDAMAPSTPTALAAAAPVAPAAPAESTDGSTEAAPAAPAAPAPTLMQVPLSLNVTGSYFELEQFVNKLEGLKRSFLVTGFTIGEASGESATPGDLGLTLQGRVFLAPVGAVAGAAPVAPAPAPADAAPVS